jgi:magnesium transporter
MLNIYKTIEGKLCETNVFEKGSWISLIDPNEAEIKRVVDGLQVDPDLLKAALDEEEAARFESEEGQSLIIVDIPVVEPEGGSFLYNTLPLGIVRTEENIITVCVEDTTIIEDFTKGRVKTFDTSKKTRFTLQILFKNSSKFLQYLRRIDKASTQVETALHKSMKNRELIEMLKLEKSLVFFSTSLKANEIVLEKMLKTNAIKRYPDDEDLLEDVIVENKQAIEMCTIYRDILSGTMDAFASVISNNLNMVMKFLTSVTIIIAIPTLLASLWGMNVIVPFKDSAIGFWIVLGIALILSVVSAIFLWKKKMF